MAAGRCVGLEGGWMKVDQMTLPPAADGFVGQIWLEHFNPSALVVGGSCSWADVTALAGASGRAADGLDVMGAAGLARSRIWEREGL
ncbi:hypothetical protein ACLOJK_014141 [Asimina triloba]